MNCLRFLFSDRGRGESGSIGVAFAGALGLIAAGGGVALDLSRWWNLKTSAQSAADAAALYTARELALPGITGERLGSIAEQLVKASLRQVGDRTTVTTQFVRPDTVKVNVAFRDRASFGRLIGMADAEIAVSATARLVGKQRVCMLVLDVGNNNALEASKQSKITAAECSVFVNSKNPKGLSVKDSARLKAQSICAAGGFEGGAGNFEPAPRTDCPPMPDPLSARAPPPVGGCNYSGLTVETGVVVLRPGVYCGGLKITNNAVAKLDPGIYVIKDGKLIVDSKATMEGVDVGFYLLGNSSQFEFDKETTINISAPSSGAMVGLLFYEDRASSIGSKHMILSNNAHTLLGTIYLPRGILFLDSERPISNRAAYTIVIANRVQMISGPELVLNARYDGSTVPVPPGVGPISGAPALIR